MMTKIRLPLNRCILNDFTYHRSDEVALNEGPVTVNFTHCYDTNVRVVYDHILTLRWP